MQMRSTGPENNHTSALSDYLNVRSVALTVIAVAVGMYVLQWAQEVFIPIVLSVLVSYALEPVVLWLMRLRLPRIAAKGAVNERDIVTIRKIQDLPPPDDLESLAAKIRRGAGDFDDRPRLPDFGTRRYDRSARRIRGVLVLTSTKPISSRPRRPARPIIWSKSCGAISRSRWS